MEHPIVPSFHPVFGAGNVFRFDLGVFSQHRIEHVVNRHVVNFLQIFLKALAIAAIGVCKYDQFAFAIRRL